MDIQPNSIQDRSQKFDFKLIIGRMLSAWPWFLLSIGLGLFISFSYLRYSTPKYLITARLLVNDDKKGGLVGQGDVLADMGGLLGVKSSIDNEVEILKTRDLIEKVVRDMKLNIKYYKKGSIKSIELYKSPFEVTILKQADTIKTGDFILKPLKNGKILLTAEDTKLTTEYDKPITLDHIGVIQIHNNEPLKEDGTDYEFVIKSIDAASAELLSSLTVLATNTKVTIIDLTLSHVIPKKGEDILNKLIEKYVQSNIDDKNMIADSTIKFIHNRLSIISNELGDLEGNIQGFKEKNNLADMSEQSKTLIQNTTQYVNDLSKIETQLSILSSLQEYLKDDSRNKRVLPSAVFASDAVFNGLIERYNSLLIERDKRLLGETVTNPKIVNLDNQIANLRADMLSNIENTQRTFRISRDGIRRQISSVENNLQQVPKIERNYLNLARQQQIKQELYLFLMKKSEETSVSKTANLSNSKTIDSPKSALKPFSPQRAYVMLVFVALGLILPVAVIYLKDLLNTRIESKDDITRLTDVPIVGEISHNEGGENLIIAANSRSAISEQFRALRTNLSFYLNEKDKKTILLTSSMSGEGKSFVAINLGNILALTGKKVLLMELDLRKPGLTAKIGASSSVGFTNFIINQETVIDDLIKPVDIHPSLFLLSSGPIPPNPAESIMSERTKLLLDELKKRFDYIIIDAPPVGIIADAQLLAPFADTCLYLVRQNYTHKDQLNIVQSLKDSGKMDKLAIVVNDIQLSKGYGYGYGYGGYGYGYGEYGSENVQRTLWQRITRR